LRLPDPAVGHCCSCWTPPGQPPTSSPTPLTPCPPAPPLQVLLVGISNSIDLTERTLPALRTRGCQPSFVCFPAYSAPQVKSILAARLAALPWPAFDDAALDVCARHVSASSGDLRHALRACGQALDARCASAAAAAAQTQTPAQQQQQQQQQRQQRIGPRDMSQALAQLVGARASNSTASAVAAIRSMPTQQQLMMFVLARLTAPKEAPAACGPASHLRPDDEFDPLPALAPQPGGRGRGRGRPASPASASKAVSSKKSFSSSADLGAVYEEYCGVCRRVAVRPVDRPGLRGVTELLCAMGLAEMLEARAPRPARLALKTSLADVRAALGDHPLLRSLLAA
jgi:hypothetical protein